MEMQSRIYFEENEFILRIPSEIRTILNTEDINFLNDKLLKNHIKNHYLRMKDNHPFGMALIKVRNIENINTYERYEIDISFSACNKNDMFSKEKAYEICLSRKSGIINSTIIFLNDVDINYNGIKSSILHNKFYQKFIKSRDFYFESLFLWKLFKVVNFIKLKFEAKNYNENLFKL